MYVARMATVTPCDGPEGSLLADRFKSLQKRNLIETRVKAKIVKNGEKRKRVEKRSYKMHFDKVQ